MATLRMIAPCPHHEKPWPVRKWYACAEEITEGCQTPPGFVWWSGRWIARWAKLWSSEFTGWRIGPQQDCILKHGFEKYNYKRSDNSRKDGSQYSVTNVLIRRRKRTGTHRSKSMLWSQPSASHGEPSPEDNWTWTGGLQRPEALRFCHLRYTGLAAFCDGKMSRGKCLKYCGVLSS